MSCTPFSDVSELLDCALTDCEPELLPYVKQAIITVNSAGKAFFKAFDDFSFLSDPDEMRVNILTRDFIRNAVDSLGSKCEYCKRLVIDAVPFLNNSQVINPEEFNSFIKEIISDSLFLGHYINDEASIKAFNEFSDFY